MSSSLISVAVITYNQEKYIKQTLDSIISQQHEWKYEIIIGEDCSSDGTKEILRDYQIRYPDIVKPIFNCSNMGLIRNYFNVLAHCSGEYIMECAGDDYWLPGKVSTQMDFMLANREIGMCYGKVRIFDSQKKEFTTKEWGAPVNDISHLISDVGLIPPMTMCFRKKLIEEYQSEINPIEKPWLMEDYPFYFWLIQRSRICFLDVYFGVYRKIDNSVAHQKQVIKQCQFQKSVIDVQLFYANHLGFAHNFSEDVFFRKYLRKSFMKNDYESFRAIFPMISNHSATDIFLYSLSCNKIFFSTSFTIYAIFSVLYKKTSSIIKRILLGRRPRKQQQVQI